MRDYISYHGRQIDRPAVAEFIKYNHGRLVGEYVEGPKKWPFLVEAVQKCQEAGATLVIVKSGRYVRNPKFLSLLSGVDFVCLDNEHCNPYTLGVLVATAEEQSAEISHRTHLAVAEMRKKGIKLGSARPGHWEGREHLRGTRQAIAKSAEMRRTRARQTYEFLLPDLKRLRMEGKSQAEIATWLNEHGHLTTAGTPFNQVSVQRLLKRYLGDDFLGRAQDSHGNQRVIPCMEKRA